MTIENIQNFLCWSTIINAALIFIWLIAMVFLDDFIYKMHTKFFKLNRDQFNASHYNLLGAYKLATFFFNVVPLIVLCLI